MKTKLIISKNEETFEKMISEFINKNKVINLEYSIATFNNNTTKYSALIIFE